MAPRKRSGFGFFAVLFVLSIALNVTFLWKDGFDLITDGVSNVSQSINEFFSSKTESTPSSSESVSFPEGESGFSSSDPFSEPSGESALPVSGEVVNPTAFPPLETPLTIGGQGRFYYTQLSYEDQALYESIRGAIATHSTERFPVESNIDSQHLLDVFTMVRLDYPEAFWLDQIYYYSDLTGKMTDFSLTYFYNEDECNYYTGELKRISEELLKGTEKFSTDYDKVLYLYEELANHIEYNYAFLSGVNQPVNRITHALVEQYDVCGGYAYSMKYLLDQLSIPCIALNGYVQTQNRPHAWNMVEIDGYWYVCDPTYGDSIHPGAEHSVIRYEFFIMDDEKAQAVGYTPDVGEIDYPDCTSDRSYLAENGLLFSSYDENAVRALFEEKLKQPGDYVFFMLDSDETYDEFYQNLFSENGSFSSLVPSEAKGDGVFSYSYMLEEDANCIYIFL